MVESFLVDEVVRKSPLMKSLGRPLGRGVEALVVVHVNKVFGIHNQSGRMWF